MQRPSTAEPADEPAADGEAAPIVSIVVPTFNRLDRLRRCLDEIRRNVTCTHEMIVVDGGSTDGTREWLATLRETSKRRNVESSKRGSNHDGGVASIRALCASKGSVVALADAGENNPTGARESSLLPTKTPMNFGSPSIATATQTTIPNLRVILEPTREGAVKAFNRGFRAAVGHYVMWLNDDAYPLPGAVEAAIAMIERSDLTDVGMVAFYHNWHSERNVLDRVTHEGETYELCHVRGYTYANFGLLRRSLLEHIGYADERYYFFGFDPDLSLKVQLHEGLKVVGCRRALIHHDEHHDERKLADLTIGQDDNAKLFAKWPLPERGAYADPTPAYLELLAARGLL